MVMGTGQEWFDIMYLRSGNPRQQAAWQTLTELAIFAHLARFTPVLTGTVPIDLDLPGSDLDIICQAGALDLFERVVQEKWGDRPDFGCKRRVWQGRPSVVATFDGGAFPIQLFAQDRPVTQQNAFRHMVIEDRLLNLGGEDARSAIMGLRRAGMKTEPAFARYFGLTGDPYAELLRLSWLDDAALHAFLDTHS